MSSQHPEPAQPACRYTVHAERCPSVLPNLLSLIAKRGIVPEHMEYRPDGSEGMIVSLTVHGLEAMVRDHIGESMRQVIGVEVVLVDEVAQAQIGKARQA